MARKEWKVYERKYCIDFDQKTFTKTEIPVSINAYGMQTTPWKSRERITNEYLALKLIEKTTTIPVPRPLSLIEKDGCLSVTMEYVPGVGLDVLRESIRPAAVKKANKFIQDVVLPQLARLESDCNGALTGDIIPPRRVAEKYENAHWESKRSPTKPFTFCHNDLGQHNILCDKETGDILSIIDWEYAGYYDSSFEGSLWLKPCHETVKDEKEIEKLAYCLAKPAIGI
jgi:aminoglycoside phosphotransferase (APT) family kinase protein